MKKLLVALMLWAAPIQAACHTFNFDNKPAAFDTIGVLNDGAFSASFNGNWRSSFDRDDCPSCVPDSLAQTDFWFSLANERGNVAARYSCYPDANGSDDIVVEFSEPVLSASFMYSSGFTYCRCFDPECQYLICQAGAIAPGSNARAELTKYAGDIDEFPFTGGRAYFDSSGYYADINDGQFHGDPNGVYYEWHRLTVNALEPCKYLHVKVACVGGGFFLDDLTVCTQGTTDVPNPPTRVSRKPGLYDIAGRRLHRPPRGVYIEVRSDGTSVVKTH